MRSFIAVTIGFISVLLTASVKAVEIHAKNHAFSFKERSLANDHDFTIVHVGNFDKKKSKKLQRICNKKEIRGVQFSPHGRSNCGQNLRIKQVQVTYMGGFRQEISYPSIDGQVGAPMGMQTLTLIPGTRCIESLSID